MTDTEESSVKRKKWYNHLLKYVLMYALWAVLGGLCLAVLLIARRSFIVLLAILVEDRWVISTWDKVFSIFLGAGFIAVLIYAERKFGSATGPKQVFGRFCRISGPLALAAFVSHVPVFVASGLPWSEWWTLLLLGGELIGGGLLLAASRLLLRPASEADTQ